MAAVYKVGKKWRADWTDLEGIRHRMRFDTKGEADAALTEIRSQLNAGTYVAPKKIPTFGALADSWITGRIEQSRTPGGRLSTVKPGAVAKPYRAHENQL